MNNKIAITLGDFNGIGPEVTIKALNYLKLAKDKVVLIGHKSLLSNLVMDYDVVEIPFDKKWLSWGQETKESGDFAYKCLIKACDMVKAKMISSVVTAPVSKNAMHLAGHFFSGQTEVLEKNLANKEKNEKAEMVFVSGDLRVLLLTRHLPLKDVKITEELLTDKIVRINSVLINRFGIKHPKLALCSLNPHAGENGILGKEEINTLIPAVDKLRSCKIDITNPMPSDTLFAKAAKAFFNGKKQPYDIYCACYHDQGLIPVKVLAMDKTVNMTAGLSIIRTSPAHGTAYDIAGKGIANEQSMICAITEALKYSAI